VIEGAAAVGIAALLDGRIERINDKSGPVVLVLSGANIDIGLHRRLLLEA